MNETNFIKDLKLFNIDINNIKRVFLISHSSDLDGWASGITSKQFFETNYSHIIIQNLYYNYQQRIFQDLDIDLLDIVTKNDLVIFMDCCMQIKENLELYEEKTNLIVIDHHHTSINVINKINQEKDITIKGIQTIDYSGCELTYIYFYLDYVNIDINKIPLVLKLLGYYDRRNINNNEYSWDNILTPFQWGARTIEGLITNDINTGDELKNILNDNDILVNDNRIQKIINEGKVIIKFITNRNISVIKDTGFECCLATQLLEDNKINILKYRCFCASDYRNNSFLFESGLNKEVYNNYDLLLLVKPNIRRNEQKITIINTGKIDIDVEHLCNILGGGGHGNIGACRVKTSMYKSRKTPLPIMCLEELPKFEYIKK
jgi:oligoribonuclease NrnB/cAMP/cGMP phosphodiesterase (DHH superfamily)